jgi:hypothetical protein
MEAGPHHGIRFDNDPALLRLLISLTHMMPQGEILHVPRGPIHQIARRPNSLKLDRGLELPSHARCGASRMYAEIRWFGEGGSARSWIGKENALIL